MTDVTSRSRDEATALVRDLQDRICTRASQIERTFAARIGGAHAAEFRIDGWQNEGAPSSVSGRGSTRVIADGAVFEKGGVNTSIVTGTTLPPSVVAQRPELAGHSFFAAGVSVVFHPHNPNVPTAHCNFRYFEAQSPAGARSAWWFGGGADLTPYFPVLEDVRHFHRTLRTACDRHDPAFYPAFKAWCDRYFFLKHRGETRGVGGIFYDYLDAHGFGESHDRTTFAGVRTFEQMLAFMHDVGSAFIEAYFPIVERHALEPFDESERSFQLYRRGRYVEFNLLYDRGTHFGLQSGGRTESILMSLPPLVRWAYDEQPRSGTRETELQKYLVPRDWLEDDPSQA